MELDDDPEPVEDSDTLPEAQVFWSTIRKRFKLSDFPYIPPNIIRGEE
jgi:hypothetical protein